MRKSDTLEEYLIDLFQEHPEITRIALNYTTMDDVKIDIIVIK